MVRKIKFRTKLKVLSDKLAETIYEETYTFPKYEMYSLGDQIRRAAISVPANIAEGFERTTDDDKKRFMVISISSLAELKYLVFFAYKRKYIKDSVYDKFVDLAEELSRLLSTFIKILKQS